MKAYENEHWYRFNRLGIGRRLFVLGKIRSAAAQLQWGDLVRRCDHLIAQERTLQVAWKAYETAQAQASTASWSALILALDAQLDRLLTELRDLLEVQSRRPETERGAASKRLFERHFAMGVTWYTHASIEDESARVGLLVAELAGEAELIEQATVAVLVAEIAAVHQTYASEVARHERTRQPPFEPLRAAELTAHRDLLGLIGQVLAATEDLPPADRLARREALLAEAVNQDAEVTAIIRARRRVPDVDPESGTTEG